MVRIVFDPAVISYQELLEVFWASHDSNSAPYLWQYRNAVLTLDERQRQLAEQSKEQLQTRTGQEIRTAIEPVAAFTVAEDYHQKHYLRGARAFMDGLRGRYAGEAELLASTEATRLNGYLGCNGEPTELGAGIADLGLSAEAQQQLLDYLTMRCRNFKGAGCALPAPSGR